MINLRYAACALLTAALSTAVAEPMVLDTGQLDRITAGQNLAAQAFADAQGNFTMTGTVAVSQIRGNESRSSPARAFVGVSGGTAIAVGVGGESSQSSAVDTFPSDSENAAYTSRIDYSRTGRNMSLTFGSFYQHGGSGWNRSLIMRDRRPR